MRRIEGIEMEHSGQFDIRSCKLANWDNRWKILKG
jgi:hypothetical protein